MLEYAAEEKVLVKAVANVVLGSPQSLHRPCMRPLAQPLRRSLLQGFERELAAETFS